MTLFIPLVVVLVGCTSATVEPQAVPPSPSPVAAEPSPTDTPLPEPTATDSAPTPVAESTASPTATPTEPPLTVATADDVQRMSVAEARELLARDMVLLYDVRSVEEYRALHIAGALPFPETEMTARFSELPEDEMLVFY
jgi:hypothetical protein